MNNQNIIYRPALMDDAQSLCSIEAIRLSQMDPRPEIISNSQLEAHWNELMGRGLDKIHIAELPDTEKAKLIGYAVLGETVPETDLFILRTHRRRGIASGLLKSAGIYCEPVSAEIITLLGHDEQILETLAV